jgi:hypothetical protein
MKKHVIISLVAVLAVMLLIVSCSDRHTNVPLVSDFGRSGRTVIDHAFVDSLASGPRQLVFQIKNVKGLLHMQAYWPDTTVTNIPDQWKGKKMPLVILLSPQDGDQFFYFSHGLMQLANEMIANGTIRPMLIVCVPNDQVFGGYFYGDSDPAGHYDQVIGDKLVKYFENAYASYLIGDSLHRGIGGVGQGAYGAFRAALKHPGAFKAVAVTDGPLDFDGADGNSGLISQFPQTFIEQGINNTTFRNYGSQYPLDNVTFGPTTPVSRMFVGGAVAFSPHVTDIYDSFVVAGDAATYYLKVKDTIVDNTTLITRCIEGTPISSVVMTKPGVGTINWDFHLPFDSLGHVYHPIWDNYWMPNNLQNLMEANTPGSLSHVNMWFGTSLEAEDGFYPMTQSWIQTLKNANYSDQITEFKYTGYPGNPTTDNQYMYDLLRQMLIFYSNSFGQ